jgi:hypothetical protein
LKRSTIASRRSFRFDFANKMFEVAGVVPELEMMGPYKLDGKILLLPVQGEGDSVARLSE